MKEKLLSLNIFEDNEYLDAYIKLIEANKETKKEQFKTALHHIIPKAYFKKMNLPIDNSKDNLVNLLHKDHALAHYYLTQCIINKSLLYKLQHAFLAMWFSSNFNGKINEIDLENIQKIQEDNNNYKSNLYKGKPGKKRTLEQKEKIKKLFKNQHKGFIWINNGIKQHLIPPSMFINYEGFVRGRLPISNKTKENLKIGQQSQKAIQARLKGVETRKNRIQKLKEDGIITLTAKGKKVLCIETNKIFNSIKEAKLFLGRGDIQSCCNHLQEKAGNYHWAFIDDLDYIEKQKQKALEYKIWKEKKITKNRNVKTCKRIICVEQNLFFNSIAEAKNWLLNQNLTGDIYEALDNQNKTAGTFHWISLKKEN